MNFFRYVCLMPLPTVLLWAQIAPQGQQSTLTRQPHAVVNNLYKQVVVRHPLGIPYGTDMKAFAPYLSNGLLHRFDLNNVCFADWRKRNPDPGLKPPVGLIENGVFSGGDEEAQPGAFQIERVASEKDGSSHVYVRLTGGDPPDKPLVWRVAVVVVRESGRLVVDDVIYLKDKNKSTDIRLSKLLSEGCNGPHWVGEDKQPL